MTRFGRNMKLTIDRAHRERARAAFEAIGMTVHEAPVPNLELYRVEGFQIGAYYGDAAEALGHDDQRKGAWLEFLVGDVKATGEKLDALGVERVTYADKDHPYFQIPGGPVFRLAAS